MSPHSDFAGVRESVCHGRTSTRRRHQWRAETVDDSRTSSSPIYVVLANCRTSPGKRRSRTAVDSQRQEEESKNDVHRASDLRTGETVRAEEISVAEWASSHGGTAQRHGDTGEFDSYTGVMHRRLWFAVNTYSIDRLILLWQIIHGLGPTIAFVCC